MYNFVKCVTYEAVDRLWIEPVGNNSYAVWRMGWLGGCHQKDYTGYIGNAYAKDIAAAWIDADVAQG